MLKMQKEKETDDIVYYHAYPSGRKIAYYFSVNKKTERLNCWMSLMS